MTKRRYSLKGPLKGWRILPDGSYHQDELTLQRNGAQYNAAVALEAQEAALWYLPADKGKR